MSDTRVPPHRAHVKSEATDETGDEDTTPIEGSSNYVDVVTSVDSGWPSLGDGTTHRAREDGESTAKSAPHGAESNRLYAGELCKQNAVRRHHQQRSVEMRAQISTEPVAMPRLNPNRVSHAAASSTRKLRPATIALTRFRHTHSGLRRNQSRSETSSDARLR